MEPDRPLHDQPTACVIAHHYVYVSLRLHSREELGARFKNFFFFFTFYF